LIEIGKAEARDLASASFNVKRLRNLVPSLKGNAVSRPKIVLAGASGDLGYRITKALLARGAEVCALVRNDASPASLKLKSLGTILLPVNVSDAGSVAAACAGAVCVVSALNGLHEVIAIDFAS